MSFPQIIICVIVRIVSDVCICVRASLTIVSQDSDFIIKKKTYLTIFLLDLSKNQTNPLN